MQLLARLCCKATQTFSLEFGLIMGGTRRIFWQFCSLSLPPTRNKKNYHFHDIGKKLLSIFIAVRYSTTRFFRIGTWSASVKFIFPCYQYLTNLKQDTLLSFQKKKPQKSQVYQYFLLLALTNQQLQKVW